MLRLSQSVRVSELASLQYVGLSGISQSCYRALERLAQCGEKIENARLITCRGSHAFLLHIEIDEWVVIQSGFSSGYTGEGPCTLAKALHLLETLRVSIEEVDVTVELFERLEAAALTHKDFALLRDARPVTPWRWPDYIYEWRHMVATSPQDAAALQNIPLAMTWPLIDLRLSDVALEFLKRPEDNLLKGFRRLEDVLRSRTALSDHGAKLFQRAFGGDSSKLMWPGIDSGEQAGRAQLFAGAFMAFRNPLAHREKPPGPTALLHQFVQLNQLFLMEAEACVRPDAESEGND